jgi:hypothetical protein
MLYRASEAGMRYTQIIAKLGYSARYFDAVASDTHGSDVEFAPSWRAPSPTYAKFAGER